MAIIPEMLPVQKAAELEKQSIDRAWLIQSMWSLAAVGIIGGAPKCCKSWLGLDMAVSVASGTPCLDRHAVHCQGTALVFLAEDAIVTVRARIEALCRHRNLKIENLDLYAITAPALRLDLGDDQQRLSATLDTLRPKLLVLDPLVRLHRLDENSASDISKLLGFLRELQRKFDCAIVLVHHASKKHRAQPGQALRGSSDLHAFGDSNAYLTRKKDRLTLTLEHRAAKPPDPFELELLSNPDSSQIHLEIVTPNTIDPTASLQQRVLTLLNHSQSPMTRTGIRSRLRVNNQRLGQVLDELSHTAQAVSTRKGWVAAVNSEPTKRVASDVPKQLQLQIS